MQWLKLPGLSDYKETLVLMENLVQEVASGTKPDTIILTEHKSVITSGTSATSADIVGDTEIPIIQIGRGGKYTFHGPGQRVIYPIIDLKKNPWNSDLKKYLNFLHSWIIATLEHLGINAHIRDDHIGIWVNQNGIDAKVAAIGIRARKWVAFHGVAVNINTDLTNFKSFVPCGINDLPVTSLSSMGVNITLEEFDEILKKEYYNIVKIL